MISWLEVAARQFETPAFETPHSVQQLVTPHAALNPDYLQLIDREMEAVLDGRQDRLMVSCPPQVGKSERVIRAGVTWWLHHRPQDRVVIASFEKTSAERWGRTIRNDIEMHPELGLRIRRDSRAAGRWDLQLLPGQPQGGSVFCVGVGGPITGKPADLLLIDDPVKGRAWAESATYREMEWSWYSSDARTRLGSESKVIVVGTRWHADDLIGRMQVHEPGRWRVVNIPALAEDDGTPDPLGRAPGQALANVRGQTRASYEQTRDTIGSYAFASLYQGRPAPAEGGLFKRADLRYWTRPDTATDTALQASAAPGEVVLLDGQAVWTRDLYRFMTVDLAASTRTSADYTVAAVWGHTVDGHLLLLDAARSRVAETQHGALVEPLARRWDVDWVGVEDAGQAVNLTAHLARAGIAVRPLKPVTDKVTRALPAAALVERRQMWLPGGAGAPGWVDAMLGELLGFPNAAHDDLVDVLSYATRAVHAADTSAVSVALPAPGRSYLDELGPSAVSGVAGGGGYTNWDAVQF